MTASACLNDTFSREQPRTKALVPKNQQPLCIRHWSKAEVTPFPGTTEDEIRENNACTPLDRAYSELIIREGLPTVRKTITQLANLAKELQKTDNPAKEIELASLQNRVFLLTQDILHLEQYSTKKKPSNPALPLSQQLIASISKKGLLRHMRPAQGLVLAIQAIRLRDIATFKRLCLNFRTIDKGPYRKTNLLSLPTQNGELLGNLCARVDFKEAVQYICQSDPVIAETADCRGNTLAHSASEAKSPHTLNYLLHRNKRMFLARNSEGKTALDLAGGNEICRALAMETILRDAQSAERTLQHALSSIKTISAKPPTRAIPPAFRLPHAPDLIMETLLLPANDTPYQK